MDDNINYLELGCGLGFHMKGIHEPTAARVVGVDFSESCINRARNMFPEFKFEVRDISQDFNLLYKFDCIGMINCLWYVVYDLEMVFKNI